MKKLQYAVLPLLLAASSLASATEPTVATKKNPISVHVLNLKTGSPSEGITVRLEKKEAGQWVKLASSTTNADGRINALYPQGQEMAPGDYKVSFETGEYYSKLKEDTFFPEVPVIIRVQKAGEHYHVPLLLSQYGYSTYRGS